MSYEDEIALLAEDIRRWSGADARIHQALEQMLKLFDAEVSALAFEAILLERAIVRQTTVSEQGRIADAQPDVRWVERRVG